MIEPGDTGSAPSRDGRTHLISLAEKVARSPFYVCPEKRDALLQLIRRHSVNIEFADGSEVEFRLEAIFGKIYTSIRSLQHVWAAACLYTAMICERDVAEGRGETQVRISYNENVEMIVELYRASCDSFRCSQIPPWPDSLNELTPKVDYLDHADEVCVFMFGFILLHEIAHFELGHNSLLGVGEAPDPILVELEADRWAYHWILKDWRKLSHDPRIFTAKAIGVIFALAMTDEFRFLSSGAEGSSHPKAVDRLFQLYEDYASDIEVEHVRTMCFNAVTIAMQVVAVNNGQPLPQGPYSGIAGFLEAVKARQDQT